MYSKLASIIKLSPNYTEGRGGKDVTRITPHCFVGQVTASRGLEVFVPESKRASCNYVIGFEGKIGVSVEEENRSWCSSSADNDNRAITIECASNSTTPYAFTNKCYASLVNLCEDICRRYGKTKLLWISDKNKALSYEPAADEMLLTVHRWFAPKACPGDWMMSRMSDLAIEVTERLAPETDAGDWSKEAREWAESEGLIAGYGDGEMGWTDPVTREQLAVILKRYDDARSMG